MNNILNTKFYSEDLDKELSFKEYFHRLITELWLEQDKFSGKRPFGNSGWDFSIYVGLIRNGLFPGKLDEDGYVEEIDSDAAQEFVQKNIIDKIFE